MDKDIPPGRTFGKSMGIAVDLQGIECTDLQVHVIMQEFLHHRFEGKKQLLFLVQLLFRRWR